MSVKDLFCIDKEVVFLNHGSFGACPLQVIDEYQKWQRIIESQPVEYIGRKHAELLQYSREQLGSFLNADSKNIVYVANATTALNFVAWSVDLKPGDQVLTSSLEYGAMDRMWEIICKSRDAEYVKVNVDLPVYDETKFTEAFIEKVSKKTKVLFISRITSSTALSLPISELCSYARSAGIITIIDGAHVPGQIPIDLENSSFDFFTGNCHKWMMAPKGTAFLYACPEVQHLLKPLVISWGKEIDTMNNSDFLNNFEYLGTRDISGFLTVPLCIKFLNEHLNDDARCNIHQLLQYAGKGIQDILKTPSIVPGLSNGLQMYAHQLPENVDGKKLKQRLYDDFKIEIPVSNQNSKQYIRISLQIYNSKADVNYFLDKLDILVKQCTK